MCLAVPMRVVALGPGLALVDRGGVQLPVLLHLLDEPVNVGDWLTVQAQRHALARLSAAEAEEMLAIYASLQQAMEAPP